MSLAIITGSAGLVGSEAAAYYASHGWDVIGIDNDMRSFFFGAEASTRWVRERLESKYRNYIPREVDIRNTEEIFGIFRRAGNEIDLIIHAAAQPSHDWAATDPFTDLAVNTNGTSVLLEATRRYCPEAVFIYMSTNKVYGDTPNFLPLIEL
ncbi:MAG TPA: NAD-dependent epimerase/dehydratase family protein, partial [Terriglobales bacterium]|nr:NAD-dependent epimerase/dehydratase family protein [Terriglobales bacterium]